MPVKPDRLGLSLESQIKKVIGRRILACTIFIAFLVAALTFYDMSVSFKEIQQHVDEVVKPLESFTVEQMILNNPSSVKVMLESFNKSNNEFKVEWNQKNTYSINKIVWKFPYTTWSYSYNLSEIAGYQFGYFNLSGSVFTSTEIYHELLIRIGLLVLAITALLFLLMPLAKKIPQKLFVNPTNRIIDLFSESINSENIVLEKLPKELEELEVKIKELLEKEKVHERNKATIAIGSIAEQVAHDIQSPLAALKAIVKETTNIPEDTRIMIRDSAQLISDIANNLLSQHQKKSEIGGIKKIKSDEIVSLLLGAVISQKRAQHRNTSVEINLNIAPDSHGVFASINTVDFKRVISNLVDNSVQAIRSNGIVNIYLRHTIKLIEIVVSDNGSGIDQDILAKIMSGERTTSKETGHGIGLIAAFEKVRAWGGELKISTQLNQGTTIHILLPLIESAYWFLSKLKIYQNSTIIILDDDKSIHGVWCARIKSELPNANINVLNFHTPNEILNYNFTLLESQPVQYLCDYELLGSELTGLDVIEKLNIELSSVLVTSRYEDEKIRERCAKLGVKILPKSYTVHIPIELKTLKTVYSDAEIVFIDDNKALTESWKLKADNIDKKLDTFNTVSEFMGAIENYSKETIFYIDAELDNGQSGINVAKILYEKGYRKLYLATGHKKNHFGDLPFLKDIIGKDVPF